MSVFQTLWFSLCQYLKTLARKEVSSWSEQDYHHPRVLLILIWDYF